MILAKLGGSVITDKSSPLTPRRSAVRSIAAAMAELGRPLALVHGGGSFGHYRSVEHDMHTRPDRYGARGVAVVKNSMVDLNGIVLDELLKGGLSPYCLPPTDLVSRGRAVPSRMAKVRDMSEFGLTPVTYGDAIWHGDGRTYILSGDRIMGMLARALRPQLCIFLVNVDGLYRDIKSESLIEVAGRESFTAGEVEADVTGGMRRKVAEAETIAMSGCDVVFLNGARPERIVDAVKRKKFRGTLFKGIRHG